MSFMPPLADELGHHPRHDQMFPVLEPVDIARLQRFGLAHSFEAGSRVVTAGQLSPGLIVVLSGRLQVSRDDGTEARQPIATHGANQFFGELAQLSDRPSLVDADTLEPVEALIVPSQRLRDLLVQEADLGERVMRALILRRVGLLEIGAGGPIIVGHTNQSDVLRLQSFLTRNGQPHRVLDTDSDPCAITMVERFHIDPHHLPIVLCPNGKVLRNPGEGELARCIGLLRPIDGTKVYDVAIVCAGPAGLAASVYAGSEGPFGHRPRLPRFWRTGWRVGTHRKLSRLSDRHIGARPDGARLQSGAEIRRRDSHSRRSDPTRRRARDGCLPL